MNEEDYNLRRNLVALFKMFKNKPETLAKYMVDYQALRDEFIERIINNSQLDEFARQNVDNTPYFRDLKEMKNYYNKIFTGSDSDKLKILYDSKVVDELSEEECLKKQLDEALKNEDFEKASYLRDYMNSKNIYYNPFI